MWYFTQIVLTILFFNSVLFLFFLVNCVVFEFLYRYCLAVFRLGKARFSRLFIKRLFIFIIKISILFLLYSFLSPYPSLRLFLVILFFIFIIPFRLVTSIFFVILSTLIYMLQFLLFRTRQLIIALIYRGIIPDDGYWIEWDAKIKKFKSYKRIFIGAFWKSKIFRLFFVDYNVFRKTFPFLYPRLRRFHLRYSFFLWTYLIRVLVVSFHLLLLFIWKFFLYIMHVSSRSEFGFFFLFLMYIIYYKLYSSIAVFVYNLIWRVYTFIRRQIFYFAGPFHSGAHYFSIIPFIWRYNWSLELEDEEGHALKHLKLKPISRIGWQFFNFLKPLDYDLNNSGLSHLTAVPKNNIKNGFRFYHIFGLLFLLPFYLIYLILFIILNILSILNVGVAPLLNFLVSVQLDYIYFYTNFYKLNFFTFWRKIFSLILDGFKPVLLLFKLKVLNSNSTVFFHSLFDYLFITFFYCVYFSLMVLFFLPFLILKFIVIIYSIIYKFRYIFMFFLFCWFLGWPVFLELFNYIYYNVYNSFMYSLIGWYDYTLNHYEMTLKIEKFLYYVQYHKDDLIAEHLALKLASESFNRKKEYWKFWWFNFKKNPLSNYYYWFAMKFNTIATNMEHTIYGYYYAMFFVFSVDERHNFIIFSIIAILFRNYVLCLVLKFLYVRLIHDMILNFVSFYKFYFIYAFIEYYFLLCLSFFYKHYRFFGPLINALKLFWSYFVLYIFYFLAIIKYYYNILYYIYVIRIEIMDFLYNNIILIYYVMLNTLYNIFNVFHDAYNSSTLKNIIYIIFFNVLLLYNFVYNHIYTHYLGIVILLNIFSWYFHLYDCYIYLKSTFFYTSIPWLVYILFKSWANPFIRVLPNIFSLKVPLLWTFFVPYIKFVWLMRFYDMPGLTIYIFLKYIFDFLYDYYNFDAYRLALYYYFVIGFGLNFDIDLELRKIIDRWTNPSYLALRLFFKLKIYLDSIFIYLELPRDLDRFIFKYIGEWELEIIRRGKIFIMTPIRVSILYNGKELFSPSWTFKSFIFDKAFGKRKHAYNFDITELWVSLLFMNRWLFSIFFYFPLLFLFIIIFKNFRRLCFTGFLSDENITARLASNEYWWKRFREDTLLNKNSWLYEVKYKNTHLLRLLSAAYNFEVDIKTKFTAKTKVHFWGGKTYWNFYEKNLISLLRNLDFIYFNKNENKFIKFIKNNILYNSHDLNLNRPFLKYFFDERYEFYQESGFIDPNFLLFISYGYSKNNLLKSACTNSGDCGHLEEMNQGYTYDNATASNDINFITKFCNYLYFIDKVLFNFNLGVWAFHKDNHCLRIYTNKLLNNESTYYCENYLAFNPYNMPIIIFWFILIPWMFIFRVNAGLFQSSFFGDSPSIDAQNVAYLNNIFGHISILDMWINDMGFFYLSDERPGGIWAEKREYSCLVPRMYDLYYAPLNYDFNLKYHYLPRLTFESTWASCLIELRLFNLIQILLFLLLFCFSLTQKSKSSSIIIRYYNIKLLKSYYQIKKNFKRNFLWFWL